MTKDAQDDEFNIAPNDLKPKAPVKKSTVFAIGAAILALGALYAVVSESLRTSVTQDITAVRNPAEPAPETGKEIPIDEELVNAQKAVQEEERKAALAAAQNPQPQQPATQAAQPTPQQAQAQNPSNPSSPAGAPAAASSPSAGSTTPNNVMVGKDQRASSNANTQGGRTGNVVNPNIPGVRNDGTVVGQGGGASTPAGPYPGARAGGAPAPGPGGRDPEFEADAQARNSRSMVFDDGAPPPGAVPANFTPGAMLPTSAMGAPMGPRSMPEVTPNVGQAPSAGVQQTIQGNLASIQAQMAAQARGQGAPNASPMTRDSAWAADMANSNANNGQTKLSNEVIKSYPTASRFTLHQGKTIPAVLGREINSDLPGEVTAYTTTDVYDSLGRGHLLIPKGSVMVGRYNSEIKMGQSRVMFAFNRIILPNGMSFDLPAAQGQDIGGASGIAGDVNNHFFRMFGASFFTAWLADRATPSTQTPGLGGVTTTVSPAGQVLVDTSRTILDRNKVIQPTITVAKGQRINIEVKKDMEFAGAYDRSVN